MCSTDRDDPVEKVIIMIQKKVMIPGPLLKAEEADSLFVPITRQCMAWMPEDSGISCWHDIIDTAVMEAGVVGDMEAYPYLFYLSCVL